MNSYCSVSSALVNDQLFTLLDTMSRENNLYRQLSIDAILQVLDAFPWHSSTTMLKELYNEYKCSIMDYSLRDGSYNALASSLFACAADGGPSTNQWEDLLCIGRHLLVPAMIESGETSIPFDFYNEPVSMHAIGEVLKPSSRGDIIICGSRYYRSALIGVNLDGKTILIDEFHKPYLALFVNDYEFPGGIRACPLRGPEYYDELHKSGINSVYAGLDILRKSWPCGIRLIQDYLTSYMPIHSPTSTENISASCELFPGWMVASIDTPLYMAECFVHEASHNLLYAVMRGRKLIETGDRYSYYSPWRLDMRPVGGLLHACFVFSNVVEFYYSYILSGGDYVHQGQLRLGAELMRLGIGIEALLNSSELTSLGVRLVERIARKHEYITSCNLHELAVADRNQILGHKSRCPIAIQQ